MDKLYILPRRPADTACRCYRRILAEERGWEGSSEACCENTRVPWQETTKILYSSFAVNVQSIVNQTLNSF